MTHPMDVKTVKAMREATTPEEMIRSWGAGAPGRSMEGSVKHLDLYVRRKPEMISTFAQNVILPYLERGILEPKTRQLVMVGICMAMGSPEGIPAQVANAKGVGCTEEEIMEVAYLATYQAAKGMMSMTCGALTHAFQYAESVTPADPAEEA